MTGEDIPRISKLAELTSLGLVSGLAFCLFCVACYSAESEGLNYVLIGFLALSLCGCAYLFIELRGQFGVRISQECIVWKGSGVEVSIPWSDAQVERRGTLFLVRAAGNVVRVNPTIFISYRKAVRFFEYRIK